MRSAPFLHLPLSSVRCVINRRALRGTIVVALTLGFLVAIGQPAYPQTPSTTANAAGSAALNVSPATVDQPIEAGKTITTEVALTNVSPAALGVTASISSLVPDQPIAAEYRSAYDSSQWIDVSNPSFILLANQTRVETLTINVPGDASPGGHYATLYFDAFYPTESTGSVSAQSNPRVGVLILMTVAGTAQPAASAFGPVEVVATQLEAGPTNLDMFIRNEGNVHLLPFGTITIRDVFGRKVKTLPLPLGTLLPGTTRQYNMTWEHGLSIGYYRATADVTVGSEKITQTSQKFVLLPLVTVIPIGLLVFAILSLGAWRWRRLRRRKVQA